MYPLSRLIGLAVLLAIAGWLTNLAGEQLKSTNRVQAEVNNLSLGIDKLDSLASTVPAVRPEVVVWQLALPGTEEEVAAFAQQVEALAKANNQTVSLNFDDFPQTVEVGSKVVDGLGTDMLLEGSFQGLVGFINQLSGAPYFYKIDKLTVIKNESKSGVKATLNGTLVMKLEL